MVKRTRKSLKHDIEVLVANHKTLKEFAKEKYVDEDGIANIHIYVNKDNIYNPLTDPNDPEISDEVISFIDNEAYYIPIEYQIRIVMHSEDDLDKNHIEEKLKKHYWKRLADKQDDLKNNSLISLFLFILGSILLSAYFILESIPETKDLFTEIFSIAGSFSIWEAVDYYLLNRNALKIERLNLAQLALLELKITK